MNNMPKRYPKPDTNNTDQSYWNTVLFDDGLEVINKKNEKERAKKQKLDRKLRAAGSSQPKRD